MAIRTAHFLVQPTDRKLHFRCHFNAVYVVAPAISLVGIVGFVVVFKTIDPAVIV